MSMEWNVQLSVGSSDLISLEIWKLVIKTSKHIYSSLCANVSFLLFYFLTYVLNWRLPKKIHTFWQMHLEGQWVFRLCFSALLHLKIILQDIMVDAIHNFHPNYQEYTQYTPEGNKMSVEDERIEKMMAKRRTHQLQSSSRSAEQTDSSTCDAKNQNSGTKFTDDIILLDSDVE